MAANFQCKCNVETMSWTRRGWMTASLSLLAVGACGRPPERAVPRLLFVCEAGTVKSVIAREMLRRRARTRGIAVDVFSRGLAIEDHVTPLLLRKLAADGIDPRVDPIRRLSAADMETATLAVAFHALPRDFARRTVIDWSNLGSFSDNYAPTYADLSHRIDTLLDRLVASGLARVQPN